MCWYFSLQAGWRPVAINKIYHLENAKMAFGFIQILWYDLNRKSDRIL